MYKTMNPGETFQWDYLRFSDEKEILKTTTGDTKLDGEYL